MSNLFRLWLLALLSSTALNAQDCPSGSLVIHSQSELEQFRQDFPNCTHLAGDLTLRASLTDLRPLAPLRRVGGTLRLTQLSLSPFS